MNVCPSETTVVKNWCVNTSIGWQRLIGSPKLQIIFHKRANKFKSLPRKMTHKDKGSYESSPPCIWKYVYLRARALRKKWLHSHTDTHTHTHARQIHCGLCQIPLKILHPRNLPNPETQIPRYEFEQNRNLNLTVNCETPKHLSFWIWWTLGM